MSTWSFTAKSNWRGVAPAALLAVVVCDSPTGTDSCGMFGDAAEEVLELACTPMRARPRAALQLLADACDFRQQRRRVLALRLRVADLLAMRVARGLRSARPRSACPCASSSSAGTRGVERAAARGEAAATAVGILAQELDVDHLLLQRRRRTSRSRAQRVELLADRRLRGRARSACTTAAAACLRESSVSPAAYASSSSCA